MSERPWGQPRTPDYATEAAEVSLECGLEPFILPNGMVGIHFMHLSDSLEYRSLASLLAADIEVCTCSDGTLCDEGRAELVQYRATLCRLILQLDTALKKPGMPASRVRREALHDPASLLLSDGRGES